MVGLPKGRSILFEVGMLHVMGLRNALLEAMQCRQQTRAPPVPRAAMVSDWAQVGQTLLVFNRCQAILILFCGFIHSLPPCFFKSLISMYDIQILRHICHLYTRYICYLLGFSASLFSFEGKVRLREARQSECSLCPAGWYGNARRFGGHPTCPTQDLSLTLRHRLITLRWTHITMENHHFLWVIQL